MLSVSVSDIQKNTSILTTLTEAVEVIDKRKRKTVAIIYPMHENRVVPTLAGKYKNRVVTVDDLQKAKEDAMMIMMEEKYGPSR